MKRPVSRTPIARRRRGGFTLIELLVAITVISVLRRSETSCCAAVQATVAKQRVAVRGTVSASSSASRRAPMTYTYADLYIASRHDQVTQPWGTTVKQSDRRNRRRFGRTGLARHWGSATCTTARPPRCSSARSG